MSPTELLFIGACVGWCACALCFVFIPSWRVADVVRLDDDKLVGLMRDCGDEWCYRHPEMRSAYAEALQRGGDVLREHRARYDDQA